MYSVRVNCFQRGVLSILGFAILLAPCRLEGGESESSLSWRLFVEGDIAHARREALRELMLDPECGFAIRVIDATSGGGRTGKKTAAADRAGRRRGGLQSLAVGFYRRQIGPAIGRRCVLHPSCSEYLLQAARAHGALGLPLLADRLVREPGVTARAEHPVRIGRMTRYADPLEDHTFWLRAYRTARDGP